MNSADVVGYTYDGEFYCPGCLPDGVSSNNDEVSAVFAGDEWDDYPTCDGCNETCEDVTLSGYDPDEEEEEDDE